MTMSQEAPWPTVLEELVGKLRYRAGWTFSLVHIDRDSWPDKRDTGDLLHCRGLTLDILVCVPDSYHPDRNRATVHHMIVPAATYDRRSWQRWLFDQCRLVDVHEAMEIFEVNGVRPYAPHHGPGNDPYLIFEHGSDEDVATSFLGQVKTDV